ncbi:hypothetical protein ES706_05787 [subsurface metagenome]
MKEIALEIFTIENYKIRFPSPQEAISEEKKREIILDILNPHSGKIRELAEKHNIAFGTIRNYAAEAFKDDPKGYRKRFPFESEQLSKEKRSEILRDVLDSKSGTMTIIAKKHEVSVGSVANIALSVYSKEEYEKRFPRDMPLMKGQILHNLINKILSEDFDIKRKHNPEVPILISEPRIFSNSKDHADCGFYSSQDYLQKLIQQPFLSEELRLNPKKLEHIEFVQFDYTNWLDDKNILAKILKYQHPNIMLFIVGTFWYENWDSRVKPLPKDHRIDYPKNINIISSDLFAEFIKLNEENRQIFDYLIYLNKIGDINGLKQINKNNKYKLNFSEILQKKFKIEHSKHSLDKWTN